MSMHIEGPWLSPLGKKKGKQKFRNAEEAQRARDLNTSWKEIQKKHSADTLKQKIMLSETYSRLVPEQSIPEGRNTTAHIKSRVTEGGSAALPPTKVYTGTEMLGVSQLHKSNAVPVFRKEDVIDISKMRR